jgi:hypothetical protein
VNRRLVETKKELEITNGNIKKVNFWGGGGDFGVVERGFGSEE